VVRFQPEVANLTISRSLKKKNLNPNFAEFLAFLSLLWIDFPNLSPRDSSFGKLGHVIKGAQLQCSELFWPHTKLPLH